MGFVLFRYNIDVFISLSGKTLKEEARNVTL
jgi:hypothetical protein